MLREAFIQTIKTGSTFMVLGSEAVLYTYLTKDTSAEDISIGLRYGLLEKTIFPLLEAHAKMFPEGNKEEAVNKLIGEIKQLTVKNLVSDLNDFNYGKTAGNVMGLTLNAAELLNSLSGISIGVSGGGGGTPSFSMAGVGVISESATVTINVEGIAEAIQSAGIFMAAISSGGSGNRIYEPSPKHDPNSGWGSKNPVPDQKTGQKLLDSAYSSSKNKQLYNMYEGKIIKFQSDGSSGAWHVYEVSNPAKEVPVDVLKQFLNDGLITKPQYNQFIKNIY